MKTRFPHHPLWLLSLSLGLAVPLCAQTLATDPARALRNIRFFNGTSNWDLGDGSGLSSMQAVPLPPDEAGGARRALQLDVQTVPGLNPWDIALRQDVGVRINGGEPLRLSFWAKADRDATVSAGVEQGSGDYQKLVFGDARLNTTWQQFHLEGKAAQDFAPGKTRFIFTLARQSARVLLADVRLEDPNNPLPATGALLATGASFDQPVSLVPNSNFGNPWNGSGLEIQPVDSGRADLGEAARLTIATQPANPWEARFGVPNPNAINGGDTFAVRLWARSPSKNTMSVVFQQSVAPFDKFLNQSVTLTPQWKQYRFVSTLDAARGFDKGGTNFEIHAGYAPGTIDIARVRVEDFGDTSAEEVAARIGGQTLDFWNGRSHHDSWRADALKRIEANRKADLKVRVVDAGGKPVNKARVEAKMTRHAFRFGTAVESTAFWLSDSAITRRYKEITRQNFNTITIDNGLKWPSDSPKQQEINQSILAWAKANNIEVRGHNLVWGSTQYVPPVINGKPLADLSNDELRAAIEAHVRNYVRRFKGQVYVWDVVNEATAERDIWERVGWDEFARVYKIAREEDPNVLLAYNDYKLFHYDNDADWKKEQEVIQKLVDAQAPFDILGEQAHLSAPLLPIPTVLSNLQELGKYGKGIEITEFDLGVTDDTAQADYIRDFLTACFSDPDVVSFVQWGFWQGAQWRAKEGGHTVNRDFSFRPSMNAYRDLVFKQWWTNASGTSSRAGTYATRGFKGDYLLSVTKNGKTASRSVHLDEKTGVITLVLK